MLKVAGGDLSVGTGYEDRMDEIGALAGEEQGAATQEITRSTQYAAQGTKKVSDNITGVKADADTAAGAADNVKQAAEMLETQSLQLGNRVSDLLGKIRAA